MSRLALAVAASLFTVVAVVAISASAGPGERLEVNPFLIAPDGGRIQQRGTAAGALRIHEEGYSPTTLGCLEVTCGTVGDGGVLAPTAGARYMLTVSTDSPVRLKNGSACNSFAGGSGQMVNEGAVLDWIPRATPDGGVPAYTCCAKTATSTTPLVQICPL